MLSVRLNITFSVCFKGGREKVVSAVDERSLTKQGLLRVYMDCRAPSGTIYLQGLEGESIVKQRKNPFSFGFQFGQLFLKCISFGTGCPI